MTGKIRKTRMEETGKIMEIIEDAKAFLKSSGVDQWQDGYPEEDTIKEDVRAGISYLLETKDGKIGATAAISDQREPGYENIYQGCWLSLQPCLVIHRIAVRETLRGCGYAAAFFAFAEGLAAETGIGDIKVDTHRDNRAMRRFLEKQGFTLCGVIYLADGSQRLAYEKILKRKI